MAGADGAKSGGKPAAGGPQAMPVLRAPRRDWESLRPIQTTLGEPPLVAPNARFAGTLATRRTSITGLAPLAHRVAPGAPGGLVKGSARPLPPSAPDLPVVPLAAAVPDQDVKTVSPVWADVTPAPPPGDRLVSAALFEGQAPARAPRPAPVQRAARENPAAPLPVDTATPQRRRLTLAESRRQGLGPREALPLATSAPADGPRLGPLDVPGADSQPVALPPMPLPSEPLQRAASVPVAPPSLAGPVGPPSVGPAPAPPRRFRMRPVSAADPGPHDAQPVPVPTRPALPLARSAEPALPATAAAPESAHGDARPEIAAEPAAEVERRVGEPGPVFVAAPRRALDSSSHDGGDRPVVGVPAPASPPPVTPQGRVEAVPEPLRATVQRQVGADLSGAMIQRGPAIDAQARQLDALAYTSAATIHLPDNVGGLETREAQALVVHELVHVAQQRSLGAALPAESSTRGRRLEGQAVAAERQRRAAGPLPLAQGSRAPDTQKASPESPRSMQRVADEMVSAGMAVRIPGGIQLTGPQVDTAAAPRASAPAPPAPDAPAPAAVQRAAAAPAPGAAPGSADAAAGGESDADLERLAGKLYDRIRSRLRSELVIDRERAGLATEF